MKGLLIKDFINIRKYARSILLVIAVYMLFAIMMKTPDFISAAIIVIFSMIPVTSFSYDHQAGWDEYAVSLPIPRKNMVLSKYIFSLILTFAGMLLSILCGISYSLFMKTGDIKEQLIVSYAIFAIGIVFVSIILPLIYKFGVEKSRIFIVIVYAVPFAVLFTLSQTGIAMPDEAQISRLLTYSPLIILSMPIISFMLSSSIFSKKEL